MCARSGNSAGGESGVASQGLPRFAKTKGNGFRKLGDVRLREKTQVRTRNLHDFELGGQRGPTEVGALASGYRAANQEGGTVVKAGPVADGGEAEFDEGGILLRRDGGGAFISTLRDAAVEVPAVDPGGGGTDLLRGVEERTFFR